MVGKNYRTDVPGHHRLPAPGCLALALILWTTILPGYSAASDRPNVWPTVPGSANPTNANQTNDNDNEARDIQGKSSADSAPSVHESPSLGVTNTVEQIVLPGTELTHRPVDPSKTPLIVRVTATFPHGDAFRYDISYFGMTPGEYDLRDFLVRVDGSSTDDLPPIPVKINSILEAGQIEPNDLEIGKLSRFGGYWQLLIAGAVAWVLVLLALILVGRKKQQLVAETVETKKTLAELLEPSVNKAIAGTLAPEKHAELERLLFAFWQKRLKLDHLEPAQAISQIRNHDQSGPLIKQLEIWLHSPPGSAEAPDVAKLMEPYQQFDADELDAQPDASGPGDSLS